MNTLRDSDKQYAVALAGCTDRQAGARLAYDGTGLSWFGVGAGDRLYWTRMGSCFGPV